MPARFRMRSSALAGSLLQVRSARYCSVRKAEPSQQDRASSHLVDPVVGVGGRLVSMLAHENLELATGAAALPIGEAIARAKEPGAAAQVEVAHEHTAEVRNVADV